jgi:hypothetical protein
MTPRRRQMRTAKELDTCSGRLPGDVEDDMLGRIDRRKRGTARGSPRRSRKAKAAQISRSAMKLYCACEWAVLAAAPVRVRSWGLTVSKVAVAGGLFFCPPMTRCEHATVLGAVPMPCSL